MDEKPRVGVLSFHNSKETKSILNSLEEMGVEPVWIMDRNLSLEMTEDGLNMEPECDIVINRMLLSTTAYPIELLGIVDAISNCCPVLNHPQNVMTVLNKISSTSAMSSFSESKVPESYFGMEDKVEDLLAENVELIQKRSIGTHGASVSMVEDIDSAISNVFGKYSFTQRKVQQDGNERDIRVYVVGDEIIAAMERESAEDEWRTNIARGASANSKAIDAEVEESIVSVCKKFGMDYAGVDLMIDEDDNVYFLEVNPTAGFKGLFGATNISPAPYIAQLACEKIGYEVDDDLVENLSKELDDSIPGCKPMRFKKESPKIGLKAVPHVAGLSNSKPVEAKVDTGATRTSIDLELASELGLGPIKDYTAVRTGSSKNVRKRPVVEATIKLKGLEHTIDVSVEDREHMKFDLILGRDILQHYKIYPDLSEIDESGVEE